MRHADWVAVVRLVHVSVLRLATADTARKLAVSRYYVSFWPAFSCCVDCSTSCCSSSWQQADWRVGVPSQVALPHGLAHMGQASH